MLGLASYEAQVEVERFTYCASKANYIASDTIVQKQDVVIAVDGIFS